MGIVLAAAAAAACTAVKPRVLAPSVTVPAGWQQAAVAGGTNGQDLSRWWTQFGDPLLTGYVDAALANNHDLRTAQARLREARLRRVLAGKDLRPDVSVSASAGSSKSVVEGPDAPARHAVGADVDASWEPDIFGGIGQGVAAAQADMDAAAADLASVQVSLTAEVALSYLNVRAYQARLAIARENLGRQQETLQITVWRAQAGLVGDLDVEQARTNVEQTRAQIPALDTGLASAAHALALLLGRPPASCLAELDAVVPLPRVPAAVLNGIPAETLRQRPDVRAAERRLAAETARLGQAEAARYPSLRLSGSFGLQTVLSSGASTAQALSGSLLGGLAAPIFDRDRIRQQIAIQSSTQERALLAYEQAMLSALEDVENALVGLANTRARQEALTAAAGSARSAAQMARDRYAAGLVSYQTVLDTERSVLSAEDALTSVTAESATAVVKLYKALGGGWSTSATTDPGVRPQ
jgi:NodT family efflux transporter outer membrane factor (OMF) lipoprotein